MADNIYPDENGYMLVASSPGDICIIFNVPTVADTDGDATMIEIPVKTMSMTKSVDVTHEHSTGSHQTNALVVGKIDYEGDFTLGTWWVDSESNPSTWDQLVRKYLTYQTDEGLPREFDIQIQARSGASMVSRGTGLYGGVTASDTNLTIMTLKRCKIKGDGMDIPEVGGTVTRKYPFSFMRRDPL